MSNRRQHRRWPRRIQVRFWRPDRPQETYHGFTSDVSETGAYITTTTPVGTNSRIRVELLSDRGGFVAEAIVRRSRRVHRDLQAVSDSGMGVRFLGIAELIHEILPHVEAEGRDPESDLFELETEPALDAEPTTDDPPPPAGAAEQPPTASENNTSSPTHNPNAAPRLELPVRFRGVEDLRQIFERDLQHGGLFLATSRPAAVGTRVRLALHLPGADAPLLADAQVVQVFEAGTRASSTANLLSGMGVLFDDPGRVLAVIRPLLAGAAGPRAGA